MRFRYIFLAGGSLAGLITMLVWDPLSGDLTKDWLVRAVRYFMAVAMVFYGYRALHDYPEADGQSLHARAKETPSGAGMAIIGRAVTLLAMAIIAAAMVGGPLYAATIPAQAHQYLPILKDMRVKHWPTHLMPEVLAGQIEHESGCPSMPKKCWNPKARLKSAREEGAGFPQITKAYRADGTLRFDALAEIKAQHPDELLALHWGNVYVRPELQLLVVVLKNRDNWGTFRSIKDPEQRLLFAIKSYNRGIGGVMAEIKKCKATQGCNPQRFTGHVGNICTASWKPIYGAQSPCSISLKYVADVVVHRSPKYRGLV